MKKKYRLKNKQNKFWGLFAIGLGLIVAAVAKDITLLVVTLPLGLLLFFSKRNWIN